MTETTFDGLSACSQVLLCPCCFGTDGAWVRLAGPAVSTVHWLSPASVTHKGRRLNWRAGANNHVQGFAAHPHLVTFGISYSQEPGGGGERKHSGWVMHWWCTAMIWRQLELNCFKQLNGTALTPTHTTTQPTIKFKWVRLAQNSGLFFFKLGQEDKTVIWAFASSITIWIFCFSIWATNTSSKLIKICHWPAVRRLLRRWWQDRPSWTTRTATTHYSHHHGQRNVFSKRLRQLRCLKDHFRRACQYFSLSETDRILDILNGLIMPVGTQIECFVNYCTVYVKLLYSFPSIRDSYFLGSTAV